MPVPATPRSGISVVFGHRDRRSGPSTLQGLEIVEDALEVEAMLRELTAPRSPSERALESARLLPPRRSKWRRRQLVQFVTGSILAVAAAILGILIGTL